MTHSLQGWIREIEEGAPDDTLLIIADWMNDHGELVIEAGVRWMGLTGARPIKWCKREQTDSPRCRRRAWMNGNSVITWGEYRWLERETEVIKKARLPTPLYATINGEALSSQIVLSSYYSAVKALGEGILYLQSIAEGAQVRSWQELLSIQETPK